MLRDEFLENERVLLRKTYEGLPAQMSGVVVEVHFETNKLLVRWDQVEGCNAYGEAIFTEATADFLIKAEPVKIESAAPCESCAIKPGICRAASENVWNDY